MVKKNCLFHTLIHFPFSQHGVENISVFHTVAGQFWKWEAPAQGNGLVSSKHLVCTCFAGHHAHSSAYEGTQNKVSSLTLLKGGGDALPHPARQFWDGITMPFWWSLKCDEMRDGIDI